MYLIAYKTFLVILGVHLHFEVYVSPLFPPLARIFVIIGLYVKLMLFETRICIGRGVYWRD